MEFSGHGGGGGGEDKGGGGGFELVEDGVLGGNTIHRGGIRGSSESKLGIGKGVSWEMEVGREREWCWF